MFKKKKREKSDQMREFASMRDEIHKVLETSKTVTSSVVSIAKLTCILTEITHIFYAMDQKDSGDRKGISLFGGTKEDQANAYAAATP